MREGIDICSSAGKVDFKKIKEQNLFVIIRCGWGGNYTNQDDARYLEYVKGCKAAGVDWGLYLYSYATNQDKYKSELAHIERILKNTGMPPLGVWLDIEDTKTYTKAFGSPYTKAARDFLNDWCMQFYGRMNGRYNIECGIYANSDYFKNVLNYNSVTYGVKKWVANWSRKTPPTNKNIKYWQYRGSESKPKVDGVSGAVDLNKEV